MKNQIQQSTIRDDFWTEDIPLFDGTFRCYHNKPRPVRGKIHISDERYFDKYDEIIPLSQRTGKRTYVMMHPYVLEPILTFTVGLYKKPKQFADQEAAIGETLGMPKQEGVREMQTGNAQAWYYPDESTVVLWECFLENFVRDHPLPVDPNMQKLWRGFEKFLIEQFPINARKRAKNQAMHIRYTGTKCRFVIQYYEPMSDELTALRARHQEVVIKPEDIRLYLNRFVAVQVARRLTDIHDHPEGVRNMLKEVKKLIGHTMGDLHPPRYALCTQVLLAQLMMSFIEHAKLEYRPESPQDFICLWDVANGIDKALMLIVGVIYELAGETDFRQRAQQTDPPVFFKSENTDEYLWSKRETWAKRIVAAIDRLEKDPSGFSLLDENVAEVHEYYKTQRNGQLVIAGAEIAQKIYKALYPLTEGI